MNDPASASPTTAAWSASTRWLAVWAAPLAVVASHLGWLWRDTRMPTDLSLFWSDLPEFASAVAGEGALPRDAVLEPGAWLQLAMALAQWVAGPSALVFQLGDALWLGILMVSVSRLLDRFVGPLAALSATCLVGTLPAVIVYARMGWVHLPEAALVTAAMAVWACGRPGRLQTASVAVLGALALALRPSAVVWLGPFAVGLIAQRAPWPIAVAWALGALPAALSMPRYIDAKLSARARYALDVPALGEQLTGLLGCLGTGGLLLGGALLAVRLWRGPRPHLAALALAVVYSATPLVLFFAFRAGLDNFTLGFVSAAVLAGIGLSVSRWTTGCAVVAMALFTGLQHVPPPPPSVDPILAPLRLPVDLQLRNAWRPFVGWSADDLTSLLRASCPEDRCVLATDRALARPDGEEPGHLVLFLLGLDDRVELLDLRHVGRQMPEHVDALLRFDCPTLESAWIRRYPDSLTVRAHLVDTLSLQDTWMRRVDQQCAVRWMTPHGAFLHPEHAPQGNVLAPLPPRPLR